MGVRRGENQRDKGPAEEKEGQLRSREFSFLSKDAPAGGENVSFNKVSFLLAAALSYRVCSATVSKLLALVTVSPLFSNYDGTEQTE